MPSTVDPTWLTANGCIDLSSEIHTAPCNQRQALLPEGHRSEGGPRNLGFFALGSAIDVSYGDRILSARSY
jgi:hypothetical protein